MINTHDEFLPELDEDEELEELPPDAEDPELLDPESDLAALV